MSEQKKAVKIEDSIILSAIEKVKAKGFDINPYTVSDEAKVFPSDIFRTPELMKIILDAREESERWHFQPSKGETDIKFSTFEMDISKLREENDRLTAQVNDLEDKLTSPDSSPSAGASEDKQNKKPKKDSGVDFSLTEDFNEQFKDLLAMESESEVQELEKQLAESREECIRAQEEASRSKEDLNKAQSDLNTAKNELAASKDELARAQNEIVFAKEHSAQAQAQPDAGQSSEELSRMQEELERLQEEFARVEDDNRDLGHSVLGLEKVNEALNIRLRELENENRQLKESASQAKNDSEDTGEKAVLSSSDAEELQNLRVLQQDMSERLNNFEDENSRLISRIQELENAQENMAANASDPDMAAYAAELEDRVAQAEAKQSEMQEEMDVLVTQLQNSFNVGYQKGLGDGKAQGIEEGAAQAAQAIQIQPASINYDANTSQNQAFQAPDLNMLQNAGTSSSEYDSLKDLKWKDVETVYQMGGQGQPQEQEGYYPEYQNAEAAEQYEQHDAAGGYEFGGNYQNYDEQENIPQDPYGSFNQGEFMNDPNVYGTEPSYDAEPGYVPESPESVADSGEIVDFDQMDIFEDIEELERLGRIELPDDIIPLDHAGGKASQDELRELVQHKIQHAQEHSTGEVPRLVGKGTGEPAVDAAKAGAAAGAGAGAGGINKFVGQRGAHASSEAAQSATNLPVVRNVPPEVRKACQILGLAPETLTKEIINDAWKKAITAPGVHPDHGGDTEIATSINLAKQTLLKFMEQTAPKLGKKFGAQAPGAANRFTGKKKDDPE